MKRRRASIDLVDVIVHLAIFLIIIAFLVPSFSRARNNARRASCQLNQKQIILALWQYAEDNNGISPGRDWVTLVSPYVKEGEIFRCRSKGSAQGKSDYFFNARFLKREFEAIKKPETLVLLGDGNDDSPLMQPPALWLKDEYSSAWRHLGGANYGFADGHIKWFKANRINRDFRMVMP
ncbi:hypothetical protein IAD21_03410 [Abditibacteriota bacterium]|nr:hypothetical protein IAD21_03410 [Abditibacteriota bacterium]